MRRKAFTLVELLVVIGIIALLISILMPALGRAKEQANWVKCLSNLRQLGQAFTMYVNNNKGFFPRPGVGRGAASYEDWIYFEDNPNATPLPRPFEQGAIAPYLGQSKGIKEVFRCPSDDINQRRTGAGDYTYSYSVNYLICRLDPRYFSPQTYVTQGYGAGETCDTMRITKIVSPSDKILLIDETSQTVDDGCWAWMETNGQGYNVLSVRHMKRKEQITLFDKPMAGRGNVLFADGHADYLERMNTFNAKYYNPKVMN